MNYQSRQNPFKRQTNLIPEPYPRFYWLENNSNKNTTQSQNISHKSRVIDSPFEKSKFEDVFGCRNNKSESKIMIKKSNLDHKVTNINVPLSKYDNRMKLREIDNQNWKREMFADQKYKLDHFGVEALRYKSYSSGHAYGNRSFSEAKFGNSKKNQYQSTFGQQKNKMNNAQNPQSSYMLYFEKPSYENNKNVQSNTSISNSKFSNHNSGYFGRANEQFPQNKNLNSNSNSNLNNYETGKPSNDRKQSNNFVSAHRNENKYEKNPYNQNEYWNERKEKNREYQISSSSKKKSFESSFNSKKVQKKQTAFFQQDQQYIENSFHKKQANGLEKRSEKSFDSNSDLIGQNLKNIEFKRKQMSYGSNYEKGKANFYDSDFINQSDQEEVKSDAKIMKFSSSFDEDQRHKKARPSNFALKKEKQPDKITHGGREYYLVNIC